MEESVINQGVADPETRAQPDTQASDKELNFRRLEAAREADRERALRAEMQVEQMRAEMQEIKTMLQPKEEDPLDGVEDFPDAARIRAKFAKERALSRKEQEEIAARTYEKMRQKDLQENYLQRLMTAYPDFNQVVSQENLEMLNKVDPDFVETALRVPDQYEKRELTYKKLKRHLAQAKVEPKASIKEKVKENAENPFYTPASAGTGPTAMDYDLSTQKARDAAYAKLKAAQNRPVGK